MSFIKRVFNKAGNTQGNSHRKAEFKIPPRPLGVSQEVADWVFCRGYEAGRNSPYLCGWNPDIAMSDQSVRNELQVVRQKVRDLALNEPIVVRALQLYRSNVIGPSGIRLSISMPEGRQNTAVEDEIENAWEEWATSITCDVEGQSTLVELLHRAVDSWMRDGEAVIELFPGYKGGGKINFAIRLARADELAVELVRRGNKNQNAIHNGVEVDAFGKPVAYHLYKTITASGRFCGETRRVPASRIIHLFSQGQAGIYRGFPVFAPIVGLLRQLSAYREAELVAARMEAMKTGTYQAMESAIDPTQIASADSGQFYQVNNPGDVRVVPYGWEYKSDGTPAHPNGAYGTFVKTLLQTIASGLSLSYPTLASDLEGVSYSSIRAGTLEDREAYKCLQRKVIDVVLRQIFRRKEGWLDFFLLSKGCHVSSLDAEIARVSDSWTPRAWAWVDPSSDANALKIQVENGWITDSEVADSLGHDWWKNVKTKKQEAEYKGKYQIKGDETEDEKRKTDS